MASARGDFEGALYMLLPLNFVKVDVVAPGRGENGIDVDHGWLDLPFSGEELDGDVPGPEVQRQQRAPDPGVVFQHRVEEVVHDGAQVAHHALHRLPAGVTVRALQRFAAVQAVAGLFHHGLLSVRAREPVAWPGGRRTA